MSDVDDGAFGEARRERPEQGPGAAGPVAGDASHAVPLPCGRDRAAGTRRRIAMTIEREIVPRLVETARRDDGADLLADEIGRLVTLLLCDDIDGARALLREAHARGIAADVMQTEILAPAARRLGAMWEDDACDFTAVCLGVRELQGLMREFRARLPAAPDQPSRGRRILLASAPGEHHVFGIEMVAESFVSAGWEVLCRPSASHAELVRVASRDWFDVAGFSISAERNAGALTDAIRALRRVSLNPGLWVMAGGPLLSASPGVGKAIGADWISSDARAAVARAESAAAS